MSGPRVGSVGAYIYAIIEPKIEGLQWETILASKREKEKLVSGKPAILGIVIVDAIPNPLKIICRTS